ncbi:MAG: hypothetical protein ACRC46_11870 [Thermoguttaceae bacterium]
MQRMSRIVYFVGAVWILATWLASGSGVLSQQPQQRQPVDPQVQLARTLARQTLGEYLEDGSMGIIVDQREVREKLGYSQAQLDALEEIKDATDQKVAALRARFTEIAALPESQRQLAAEQLRAELIPQVEAWRADTRQKTEDIIGSKMATESRKLVFQAAGGLMAPTVSTDNFHSLNLTESQKEQIRIIAQVSREEYRSITQGVDLRDPLQLAKVEPLIQALRQRNAERIRAVLDATQLNLAEAMTTEGQPLYEAIRKRATSPRTPKTVDAPPAGEIWMPGPDSWKPGDAVPQPDAPKRTFPKPVQ